MQGIEAARLELKENAERIRLRHLAEAHPLEGISLRDLDENLALQGLSLRDIADMAKRQAASEMPEAEKLAILDKDAERIRSLHPVEAEAPPEIYECLRTQRLFLEGARKRAERMIDVTAMASNAFFPNPHDRETHIQLAFVSEAAMAFCNVKDSLGGQVANSVEECAQRCVDAEAGSKKLNKLIDDLRDENADLRAELAQAKGRKK
jgi:hypothetical protein